jgi:hypothetical protein
MVEAAWFDCVMWYLLTLLRNYCTGLFSPVSTESLFFFLNHVLTLPLTTVLRSLLVARLREDIRLSWSLI